MDFVTIVVAGESTVHFPDWSGNYETLCQMDGNDNDSFVQHRTVKTKKGAKVNCQQCINIWEYCQQFNESDISLR